MEMGELLNLGCFYLPNHAWNLSALVNIDDGRVYIGLHHRCGLAERSLIYYTLDSLTELQEAVEEAREMVASRDYSLGSLRIRPPGVVKLSSDAFETIVREVLKHDTKAN